MAATIQVVLKQDVQNLGKAGQLVRVRPGYARNYLVPRGMAAVATRGNISQIEHEQKAALAQAATQRKAAEGVAAALAEVTLRVTKRAGDEGKLFGSVTAVEVARELQAKGYQVDRKQIQMPADSIRQVGVYELTAKLAAQVNATFKLEVVSDKNSAAS